MNIEQLKEKPIWQMTGAEFLFLQVFGNQRLETPQVDVHTKKEILNINEVSTLTGYTVATIYAKVHKRLIPFHKSPNGSKLIFYEREIMEWLEGNIPPTPAEVAEAKLLRFNERKAR